MRDRPGLRQPEYRVLEDRMARQHRQPVAVSVGATDLVVESPRHSVDPLAEVDVGSCDHGLQGHAPNLPQLRALSPRWCTMRPMIRRPLMLVPLAIAVVAFGCSAGISAGPAAMLGFLLLVTSVVGLSRRSARAGAPAPCQGSETTVCQNGYISRQCCPQGAKCNYRNAPFLTCGDGYCVEGKDPGRCPSPRANVMACDASAPGRVEACVDRKVTKACVMPVPTNYTGPSQNPSFRTCGDGRCTTHQYVEDCYPTRAEKRFCPLGQWAKVCLGGRVTERCLPMGSLSRFPTTTYATCSNGSCAVGDKSACP
jgi:hypothetical protein